MSADLERWPTPPGLDPDAASDPVEHLRLWLREAEDTPSVRYASAATLSTVDETGNPDSRVVLVHVVDQGGLVFSTDRRSTKVRQLAHRSHAALLFYWGELDRQVRVRGTVHEATAELADRCFEERPKGSRVTAWVSRQSAILDRRLELEARYESKARELTSTASVPRPATWVAYRLVPLEIELWQAARFRLHHRLLNTRDRADAPWLQTLLEP